ncbi:MAG: DUF58 domain-containing protein [Synergistaceae bacterium]|nr:DUF58 domain-containing protein [Synergistaceae bacterium]
MTKRVMTVRKAGMIYIASTIVMGVLAINGGNNLHYLATAVLLGYMSASGIVGRSNLFGVGVTLTFPDEIYADTPFLLTIEATNNRRFTPVFLIDVRVGGANVFFPVIPPGERRSGAVVIIFSKRGVNYAGEIEVSSVYPFNFFIRYRQMEQEDSVLAFPKPANDGSGVLFAVSGDEGEGIRPKSAGLDSDIVGVRPYVEGDPMKRVHWKSSARTGRLNTRVYDDSPGGADSSGRILDLDGMTGMGVERGLSIACREISGALESGEAIGMLAGGTVVPASARRADKLSMLARLAVYDRPHIS